MKQTAIVLAGVFFVLAAVMAAIVLMAASVPEHSPTVTVPGWTVGSSAGAGAEQTIQPPYHDLQGKWTVDSGNGATLTATVQDRTIEIVMNNEGASMTYWVGTFQPSATIGDVISSSKVDVPRPVMSTADSKEFIVGDNTMSFEMKAMGRTTTLVLQHVV